MMHLSDEDLIRHLDHEDDPAERTGWSGHIRACEECNRRFAGLEADSRTVTRWLERAAFEVPDGAALERVQLAGVTASAGARVAPDRARPAGRPAPTRSAWRRMPASPWLRAAVIVLLMAAPAVAIPSVREWVVARVALLGSATPPAPAAPMATGAAVIRFAAAPGEFVVRVEPQTPGSSLALGRVPGEEAVLESRRAPGTDPSTPTSGGPEDLAGAPVVSAELLRLPGTPAPMQYRLRLPASTTGVVVHVGGETVRVTGAQLREGVSLAL